MNPSESHSCNPRPDGAVVEAAAAAWLSLRDRGMSPEETTEFLRWLQQEPCHEEIFVELDQTWRQFDRLAAVPAAVSESPNADLLAPRDRKRIRPGVKWTALIAAASIAVLLAVSLFQSPRFAAETDVGAFRQIDLPDGSVAQLNTDSAISANYSAGERRVEVTRGEAFFVVAKDPARPFVVSVGPIVVRAIGTAFNVRHHQEAVEILVTEGRVRIDDARDGRSVLVAPVSAAEPPVAVAGERVRVPLGVAVAPASRPAATVQRVSAHDVQRALAWQGRQLEFESTPLEEVAREFNRYNRRQLVIADPQLGAQRFSGAFRADGYESLVRLLELDFGVVATQHGSTIVLRRRP